MPSLNATPRIITIVFFREFSITGFQKGWFASDIIFCTIDTDRNSQSPFILFEASHNDHVAHLLTASEPLHIVCEMYSELPAGSHLVTAF